MSQDSEVTLHFRTLGIGCQGDKLSNPWFLEVHLLYTQETAPVRLGHFLVENDTWKKKKRKENDM